MTKHSVESLHMTGLTAAFIHLFVIAQAAIAAPQIAEAMAALIRPRKLTPEPLAGVHTAIADVEGHDLT